jgi:cell division FtsZ-interacting protein ZapD
MFTYIDAVYARMRHEEMLKEADRQRLVARVAAQHPGILERTAAALKQSLAALRSRRQHAQAPVVRRSLAAE